MTTGSKFNYFYRVKLKTASYEYNTITSSSIARYTYNFINKAFRQPSTSTANEDTGYWPILSSVGEISIDGGEILPNLSISSIVLRNERGSFGPRRRISDIFERQTPVNQEVDIFVAEVDVTEDIVNEADWIKVASGLVNSWEVGINTDQPVVTLNISQTKFEDKILNLIVSRTVPGMGNAPESSLGKAIPLVIGSNTSTNFSSAVIPIRITPDGATQARYAYKTNFHGLTTLSSSGQRYMLKNDIDDWVPWNTSQSVNLLTETPTGSHGLNTYSAQSYLIPIPDNDPNALAIPVSGIILSAKGNSTNPARASGTRLTVFILKVDKTTKAVVDTVATGRVSLVSYDAQNNASNPNFQINVSFDDVAVLCVSEGSKTYEYYLGWTVTNHGGAQELSLNYSSNVVTSLRQDTGDTTSSVSDWRVVTGNRPIFKLSTLIFSETAATTSPSQKGLTYAELTLSQESPGTGQVNPSLDNFPIAVDKANGINTGGGQTFPHFLFNTLSYEYDGTTWVNKNRWDTSILSSHYDSLFAGLDANSRARNVAAIFPQETTYSQFLTEVCRGTASRVGNLSDGKAFVYPWGLSEVVKANIPPHDILPLNWAQRDSSTVINRVILKLNNSVVLSPRAFENPYFESGGLTYSIEYSADNYPQVASISSVSRALFGDKPLIDNQFSVWPTAVGSGAYMGSSSTEGGILAEYYMTKFALPSIYCSFIVPFHRYKTLKMFDVVTFAHPEFPAYYGTDPKARTPGVDTGSAVVAVPNANNGEELVRAKTYRGQIESISYIMAMEHAPAIRLTLFVLQNHPIDPT